MFPVAFKDYHQRIENVYVNAKDMANAYTDHRVDKLEDKLTGASLTKEKINNKDVSDLERAIAFYIVNKCSFSGLTEKSTFTQQAYEQFTL